MNESFNNNHKLFIRNLSEHILTHLYKRRMSQITPRKNGTIRNLKTKTKPQMTMIFRIKRGLNRINTIITTSKH